MQRCPACGEENSDRARFCQACAVPLAEQTAADDIRKVVTIVFCDVTGSTALGERLDPEALRRVMNRYFDLMAEVIERHGGTIEKFIGDAVMAVFGIPHLHEDDPLRAVRAANGMRDALTDLSEQLQRDHGVGLQARIGVNTGEVVAGNPSADQRLVTGDAVNVAARFEQAAAPGDVLIGESTYRLVKDAVQVEPVEPLELKGKSGFVPAYRLIGVSADAAGHARHLDSPLVAREKELDMFTRALERATTDRTSHLFTLLGPAGVGKSRLVNEFLGGPAAEAKVLRGRCLSYGDGITFFPLAEIVHEAAGVLESDTPAQATSKVSRRIADSEDHERIAALVGGLLGWGPPGGTEDAFWAVRKFFEQLATERTLAIVIDDLHWAEPTFLDLVDHLADWTREAAVLVVCVARPELLDLRPGWGGGKMNATSILLEPLAGDEASLLIDNLLGRAEIPQIARDRILEAAEGNPLFVEEMLSMLIDDELLRLEGDTWIATEDLAQAAIPPTIQLLLAARLDRLDGEERAVIERGSVEGKVFHAGAVATMAPENMRPRVRARLLALARKELIRPDRAEFAGEDAFRFRHLLIRDAAYQAMSKEQRAALHERFAEWLEQAAGERIAEYKEILGHHLEQAFRYRLELGSAGPETRQLGEHAAEHLFLAAARAYGRGDRTAAKRLAERSVELASGSELAAMARHQLADIMMNEGEFYRAVELATEAEALAAKAGDGRTELLARLVTIEASAQVDQSMPFARIREDVEAVKAGLEAMGETAGARRATMILGRLAFFEGRADEGRRIAEALLPDVEILGHRDRIAIAMSLINCAYFGSEPAEEALARLPVAMDLFAESPMGQAALGRTRAGLLAMLGRFEEAKSDIERSSKLFQELGVPFQAMLSGQIVGEVYRLAGDFEVAERVFANSRAYFDSTGETGFNSTITALLAITLCELRRFDEAAAAAKRSREISNQDDFAAQAPWRMAMAFVLSYRGEHDAAIELARAAIALTEPSDYLGMQAETHETLGRVLAASGDVAGAREAFEASLQRHERKGDVVSRGRLRRRLSTL